MSDSFRPHGLYIYSPWISPGQNTGMGSLFLLQGIVPTQDSNPGLSHCRWILYQLSHKGNPRILEWVAIPSPVDLPNPGIKLGSPALQADSLPAELPGKLRKDKDGWDYCHSNLHQSKSGGDGAGSELFGTEPAILTILPGQFNEASSWIKSYRSNQISVILLLNQFLVLVETYRDVSS